jgi:hypothetical protein
LQLCCPGEAEDVSAPMTALSLRLMAVAAMGLCLAGCGKTESYRYKLTLAVNTPEGVKRGSSVVEVLFWDVSVPARGTMHKLRGEALYLDLGPGARPLIALLTSWRHEKYGEEQYWTPDAGPGVRQMSRLYGIIESADYMDDVPSIARMRGVHKITPSDLPDLVTFTDINDPKSVIEVDPNELQGALGPNITWNEITIESTDEPITKGIELKLTWLPEYFKKNLRLDGSNHGAKNELANILSWWDFDQSSDLKRSN